MVIAIVAACDRGSKPATRGAAVSARHGADSSATAPAPAPRPAILFVGTSLTAGLGLEPGQSYPDVVARRLDSLGENYEVVNAGVSGETSADLRRRLGWVLRSPAAVIVVETGANDGLRGLSADSMRVNIQAIIDTIRAREPRARIVLVGMESPPNMSQRYTAEFRKVFPELARKNGITYMPFPLANVAGIDSLNQADGIHPNRRGAELVAANVLNTLRPLLDSLAR